MVIDFVGTSNNSLTPDMEVWNPFNGDTFTATCPEPDADKEFDEFLSARNTEPSMIFFKHSEGRYVLIYNGFSLDSDNFEDLQKDLFGAKPFQAGGLFPCD